MGIVQIALLCLISAVLIVLLKQIKPEFAPPAAIVASALVMLLSLDSLSGVFAMLDAFIDKTGINRAYLIPVFKIIGIAYIAQFTAEICRDAGESAIASKVELAGKVLILVLSLPIISGLFDAIVSILP